MFPEHIFKAYDIRGLYPEELNEDVAYRIGRAFGALRQSETNRPKLTIAVGRDMRLSSPVLTENVIRGLTDQGVSVVDLGLVSTPTSYFAVANYNYDGGLMITASHNPKEYNGIKLERERAVSVGKGMGMEDIRKLAEENKFADPPVRGSVMARSGSLLDHVKQAMEYADFAKIKPMKIVADAANAMGAPYLEALFKELPQIQLVKMNFELDGTFPAHQADPFQEINLADLQKKIVEEKADLGIATDGDGDRIFFVDNVGKTIEPAIVRGIMAKLFLRRNPGAKICYDIRPGKITEEMIIENGGIPILTKVGHSFIKQKMLEEGAVFGGESSGHFFVNFPHGIYEAPLVVAVKLLQELSESGMAFSEYLKPLRRYYHSGEINFRIEDKTAVLNRLKEKFADAQINDLDGLTFAYPDYWFNVRTSNTEPLLRLNLEAKSKEMMEEKLAEVKSVIEGKVALKSV